MTKPRAAPHDAHLTLVTLGDFALRSSGPDGDALVLGAGKPLALLVYLHAAPDRSASRDHLIDLLWADLEPVAARHALRQALWYLRQRVGTDAVRTTDGHIAMGRPLACDRDDFVDLVAEGRNREAADLYRGHFLPDFAVPGGLEFEHWADAERSRLRLMFLRAAGAAVNTRLAAGHAREARDLAQRVRDGSPHSEAAWRLLLETLVAGHDTVGALAEAERLLTILHKDKRTPEPATRALLRSIETGPAHAEPEQDSGLVAELVGRERAFAAIVDCWEQARAGRALQAHVEAPAGLGKTRLLFDVGARIAASGARHVHVRANPGERSVPFALASELAAALASMPGAKSVSPACAGVLVGMNPALSSVFAQPGDPATGDEAARRRTLAVTDLLRVLADEAPVAVFVDDLHWSDAASRRLLDAVVGRLSTDRVLTVTAARPVPGVEPPRHAVPVELPPLTQEHVGALLASLGELDDDLAAALPTLVRDASEGSPLLALDCLQAALDTGDLSLEHGRWNTPHPDYLADRFARGGALRGRLDRLDRNQHWLLVLLATGGLPLTTESIAAAARRPPAMVTGDLAELERMGLTQRTQAGWEPTHDAVADAALAGTGDDARRAASAALGRALAENPQAGRTTRVRAVQLLAHSDDDALHGLFRAWIRTRRRGGDRRRVAVLAADGLGIDDPALVRRLTQSLPIVERVAMPRVVAPAAVVSLLALAFLLGTTRSAPVGGDTTLLVAGVRADGRPAAYEIGLSPTDWRGAPPLDVTEGRQRRTVADASTWYAAAGSVNGTIWARSVASDTGAVDVVIRDGNGRERWITSGPADENFEDWSPDGRFLLISTGRWHERSMYDLAVVETGSGRLRQLTSGDGHDIPARWSGDGSRIAFIRRFPLSGEADRLCWVSMDGATERCYELGPRQLRGLAWVSPAELIVSFMDRGDQGVVHVDLPSGAARTLPIRGADFRFDPNGLWLLCRCLPEGAEHLAWYATPVDQPDALRLLTWNRDPDADMKFFWRRSADPHFLDRLDVEVPSGGVAVGATLRPSVHGRDRAGRAVPTPVITWTVSDSSALEPRPDGSLRARAVGQVTLTASAGGWRDASITVRIHADTAQTRVRESWSDLSGWEPYGDPTPLIVPSQTGAGRALLVNGDGSHHSGVYSHTTLDPANGVGVEALIRTPITAPQWQYLGMRLVAPTDTATASWNHGIGPPSQLEVPSRLCAAGAGSTSVVNGTANLWLAAGGTMYAVPLPWPPSDDRWYRVRIQVLPDGRCGFAVDGVPVWVSRAHVHMDGPFRVDLTGQTVGSDLLVGALETWEGVRMDVDWGEIEG